MSPATLTGFRIVNTPTFVGPIGLTDGAVARVDNFVSGVQQLNVFVPEPGTAVLSLVGAGAILLRRRRREPVVSLSLDRDGTSPDLNRRLGE